MFVRRASQLALAPAVLAALTAPAAAGPRFKTEIQWVDPVTATAKDAQEAAEVSKILYINRCVGGCPIEKAGVNDARTNQSTIPVQNGISTISEFSGGDVVFDAVVECVREVYGPYDVEIVTEDPGTEVFHHEHIFGGFDYEVGRENSGGVAPSTCAPLNNVISYTFANQYFGDVEQLCWTVAQETAHSFGLPNHTYVCSDPMTYLETDPDTGAACGRKYFRNEVEQCAEIDETGHFTPRDCGCGVNGQNSHVELTRVFGPGTPPDPSVVDILLPDDGDEVTDGFDIFFTALNPRSVSRVELVINGTVYDQRDGHSYPDMDEDYNFTAPELPDGYLDVELVAYDDLGTPGSTTITVLKGEPCSTADTCFENQTCDEGRCVYPAPAGMLGDECTFDQFCIEGGCFDHDGDRRCATACNLGVSDGCVEGYECVDVGGGGACFPVDSGGGCCAVAGAERRGGLPFVALGLFAAAFLVLRRRRAA